MAIAVQNRYSSWFDTPYYHILYKDRGYEEAGLFMKNLTSFLELRKGAGILDLACGKGRHSLFLSRPGLNLIGVDLSQNSIEFVKQFESPNLHFQVRDMCKPISGKFEAVFNLFTSFGYVEEETDKLRAIKSIKEELKENGYGVIDFMNVRNVIANLVPREVKKIKRIILRITRQYREGFNLKNIRFEDVDTFYNYTEEVKALICQDFCYYFAKAQKTLNHTFGSYQLEEFDEKESDRLILVFS